MRRQGVLTGNAEFDAKARVARPDVAAVPRLRDPAAPLGFGHENQLVQFASRIDAAVANAERARAAGLHRYWVNQTSNADPMVTLGIVGREVADIELGTSVVAMQTTFANTLASQSRTINQATGGRFTLGLGASHKPAMESEHGMGGESPARWSMSMRLSRC